MEQSAGKLEILPEDKEKAMEAAARNVDEISFLLASWYRSRDSDSVRQQAQRKSDYTQACDRLRLVVGAAKNLGVDVSLSLPEDSEAVTTRSIRKGAYDSMEVNSRGVLSPGETILLKHETTLTSYIRRINNVYFGDYRRDMEVADIAEALGKGGVLAISPTEPTETAE
jgi:hypothetical protein